MNPLPELVVHADWGVTDEGRWMCQARRQGDSFLVSQTKPVPADINELRVDLLRGAQESTVLAGFDFPIGLPATYAQLVGLDSFQAGLQCFGKGPWQDFFRVARVQDEICLHRPFYPYAPGGKRQAHLTSALGVSAMNELLRRCERPSSQRAAASSMFWTLGSKQVGKAALHGWRYLLKPLLEASDRVHLWPFDGNLKALLEDRGLVIVETYPAEACLHLEMSPPGSSTWKKGDQEARRSQSTDLLSWAGRRGVQFQRELEAEIRDGFGTSEGSDRIDAVLGLCSMLEVVLGHRPEGAPDTPEVRNIEGWIFGQAP